ncbi:MAG TPA: hypothetical protein VFE51_28065 [Verrucomicrobiae bacterium]|nr:hypothetical protein [Verrucomicrobiae bacterium]
MTKHVICILALICTVSCAVAQTTSGQSSPTYPGNNNDNNQPGQYGRSERAPRNNPQAPAYNANQTQIEAGGVLFSNRLGQTFSAQDLAAQLQNLRNAVDQTVPILSAFNETYSNSNSGGHQTVGSTLSGIVSDVFHRNQGSAQTSANESPTTSNLLSVLHGLLNKNSTATTPAAAPNPQDLLSLQSDLQPVVSVLQRLNVQSTSNQLAAPYPNGSLTPTGR